mgnify:FL=1
MTQTKYLGKGLARTHDPKTSWEAAEKVDTNRLEGIVLRAIKSSGRKGAIHDDVYAKLELHNIRESSITPRYKQLENKGLIYRDGTTRKGSMGRSQLVMYYKEE